MFKFIANIANSEHSGLSVQSFSLIILISIFQLFCQCVAYDAEGSYLGLLLLQTNADTVGCQPDAPFNLFMTSAPASLTGNWSYLDSTCNVSAATVRRDTSGFPDSVFGSSQSSGLTSFIDSSVVSGIVYYYGIFLQSASGQYSVSGKLAGIVGSTAVTPVAIADGSIIIDGTISEAAWISAPTFNYSFVEAYGESSGMQTAKTGYIKLAYDSTRFYILFHADDAYIHFDPADNAWLDDGVEIFFDMSNDKNSNPPGVDDYQLIFPVDPSKYYKGKGDGAGGCGSYCTSWTPTISRAIAISGTVNDESDVDTGYNIEVSILLTDLGVGGFTSGQKIGFTFSPNYDDTVAHSAQHSYQWTSGAAYNNPSTWGIAQF